MEQDGGGNSLSLPIETDGEQGFTCAGKVQLSRVRVVCGDIRLRKFKFELCRLGKRGQYLDEQICALAPVELRAFRLLSVYVERDLGRNFLDGEGQRCGFSVFGGHRDGYRSGGNRFRAPGVSAAGENEDICGGARPLESGVRDVFGKNFRGQIGRFSLFQNAVRQKISFRILQGEQNAFCGNFLDGKGFRNGNIGIEVGLNGQIGSSGFQNADETVLVDGCDCFVVDEIADFGVRGVLRRKGNADGEGVARAERSGDGEFDFFEGNLADLKCRGRRELFVSIADGGQRDGAFGEKFQRAVFGKTCDFGMIDGEGIGLVGGVFWQKGDDAGERISDLDFGRQGFAVFAGDGNRFGFDYFVDGNIIVDDGTRRIALRGRNGPGQKGFDNEYADTAQITDQTEYFPKFPFPLRFHTKSSLL